MTLLLLIAFQYNRIVSELKTYYVEERKTFNTWTTNSTPWLASIHVHTCMPVSVYNMDMWVCVAYKPGS